MKTYEHNDVKGFDYEERKMMKYIAHHGVKGMKWGIRRYQNYDGSYTELGQKRYNIQTASRTKKNVDEIINSLSIKDKKLLNIKEGDEYLSVQQGEYVVKRFLQKYGDTPVAFLDLLDSGNGKLDVVIATRSGNQYRGKGYGKKLANDAVKWLDKNQNKWNSVEWSYQKGNVASEKTAKAAGFKKNYYKSKTDKDWDVYEYKKKK